VDVARVTGGEKMNAASDSGEENIRAPANGDADFADFAMRETIHGMGELRSATSTDEKQCGQ
jgi:hypothetical protein